MWRLVANFKSFQNKPFRRFFSSDPLWRPRPLKDVLFAATFCTSTFAIAAVLYDHRLTEEAKQRALSYYSSSSNWRSPFRSSPTSDPSIKIPSFISSLPLELKKSYIFIKRKWDAISEADKAMGAIIGINAVIFVFWQLPLLRPFMHRYFLHTPAAGRSITQLTSTFSHQDLWHIGFNMIALSSFGALLYSHMGKEQFSAFYLSAGVGSSLISGLAHLKSREMGLRPSLGASGALFACLGACGVAFPHLQIALIFFPFANMTLGSAIPLLAAFDAAGILFGWKMFDHVAHLGGLSLGYLYMKYGQDFIWKGLQHRVADLKEVV